MYETLQLKGQGRHRFSIVLPRDKGRFAADVAAFFARNDNYHQAPHLGVLVLDCLNGAGTLIDVGANIGLVSIPAAVYGSKVVALELLPENCLYLSLSILENRLKNIRLFQLAVGDQRQMVGFAGSEAWGRVVQPDQGPPAMMLPLDDIADLIELQSRRLRPFVKRPLVVKIDTEGHELPVLKGAARLIERFDPVLIVECAMTEGSDDPANRQTRAVKEHLEANGYHLYLHRENRLVARRAADLQEGHVCDFLASRKRYRDGDRIGRFTFAPLSFAESVRWIAEMIDYPVAAHHLHAAGVIARWRAEGRATAELSTLGGRLLDDPDPEVAAHAARLLGPIRGQ